jgi:hypothetical protein
MSLWAYSDHLVVRSAAADRESLLLLALLMGIAIKVPSLGKVCR